MAGKPYCYIVSRNDPADTLRHELVIFFSDRLISEETFTNAIGQILSVTTGEIKMEILANYLKSLLHLDQYLQPTVEVHIDGPNLSVYSNMSEQ